MASRKWTEERIYRTDNGHVVIFIPIPKPGIPGFTHKVLVDGQHGGSRFWLKKGYRPNAQVADYFYCLANGLENARYALAAS